MTALFRRVPPAVPAVQAACLYGWIAARDTERASTHWAHHARWSHHAIRYAAFVSSRIARRSL